MFQTAYWVGTTSDYNYDDYQLSKAPRKVDDLVFSFNLCLPRASGSVSSGNLSAFDIIGSKVREIAGDNIVNNGNEELHRNLSRKMSRTLLN